MIYGNGVNADFIASAKFGNSSLDSWTSGIMIPFILSTNTEKTNYAIKYPNFYDEKDGEYPLIITRCANIIEGSYHGVVAEPCTYTTGNGDSHGIDPSTYTPEPGPGYYYEPYITEFTNVCTNWFEFSKYPDNVSANFCDKSNLNWGGYGFSYTAICINSMNRDLFHRDDVTVTDLSKVDGYSAPTGWNTYASLSADFSNVNACPGYMGGMMLFSANDNDFNNDKMVAVGFKGLYTDSWRAMKNNAYNGVSNSYEVLGAGHMIHSNQRMYNVSFKLYNFDDEHFKKISNNIYLFNDKKILPVGMPNTINSQCNTKTMAYNGPFFGKLTGSVYNGTESTNTFYLTTDQYITPYLYTSIAYMTTEPMENCISASSPTTFSGTIPPIYISILDGGNDFYNSYVNFYFNANRTNKNAYFIAHPLKNCSYDSSLRFNQPISHAYFGKCLSAFSSIDVGWMNMCEFDGIEGNTWDNWYNIRCCGTIEDSTSDNHRVFYNAFKLKQIPPTWEGLNNVTGARAMFKGCSALESLPVSWQGLNNLIGSQAMFKGCSTVESLPTSWAGLENLQYANNMFSGCKNLKSIPMTPEAWSHLKNATTTRMFEGCTGLTFDGYEFIDNIVKSQECSNCTFAKVTNYVQHGGMFYGCTNIGHYNELTAGSNPAYKAYESFFK